MTVKQMPPPSANLLFFPASDTDYTHFQDAEQNKFDDTADGFSPVNAWWLADAALLAYWDARPAATIWERAGLSFTPLSNEGVQCHIGSADRFAIVAFRGTQPDDLPDLFDIANIRKIDWTFGGKVHRGFMDAHRRIWRQLDVALRDLKPRKVWFTGHSLGGAIATLSMDHFSGDKHLYTFGSPPVGDRQFAQLFDQRYPGRCFRYVNHVDIVVYLASLLDVLVGTYTHVKERKYIDAAGGISTGSPSMFELLSLILIPRVAPPVIGRPPQDILMSQALVDHTPRRYAVRIWNDYDRLPRVRGAPAAP
jgi:triacylglycerol lipase